MKSRLVYQITGTRYRVLLKSYNYQNRHFKNFCEKLNPQEPKKRFEKINNMIKNFNEKFQPKIKFLIKNFLKFVFGSLFIYNFVKISNGVADINLKYKPQSNYP